jgi:prolyl 4-hydroxylase
MLVQQITPAILKWITEQAQAGHGPEAVLQAMRQSGWNDDVARSAIEQCRRGSLTEVPPAVMVPEPDMKDRPSVLRTADREVQVLAVVGAPRVIVLGSLICPDECDELVRLAGPRLQRSTVNDGWSGTGVLSDWRTSEGMFFTPGENATIRRVEERIAQLLNWPVGHGEGMQILRYGPGAEYQPHHDYLDPTVPGAGAFLRRGGQRVATVLMYLNTPPRGGETIFPDIDLRVSPVKGNAVFFSYDRPHPVTRTLHGGAPVVAGETWVATKWLREDTFN